MITPGDGTFRICLINSKWH